MKKNYICNSKKEIRSVFFVVVLIMHIGIHYCANGQMSTNIGGSVQQTVRDSVKVIYPKYYNNSNTYFSFVALGLIWAVRQGQRNQGCKDFARSRSKISSFIRLCIKISTIRFSELQSSLGHGRIKNCCHFAEISYFRGWFSDTYCHWQNKYKIKF